MPAGALIDVAPFGERAEAGTATAFLVLAAFVVSFLLIRTSARLTRSVSWWPGGVKTEGGVHVHHLVWGICLMMFCGFLAFAVPLERPWWHIVAIAFGAVRLGHPASPWGRRRYSGKQLERAQARFSPDAPAMRWQRRLSDLVAGAPSTTDDR